MKEGFLEILLSRYTQIGPLGCIVTYREQQKKEKADLLLFLCVRTA